jgi:uncharacterized protein DUF6709
METWIHQKIRAASLRRVVTWVLSVVGVVLFGIGARRYFDNFVRGPFELGPASLDSITDVQVAPRYFARVAGSKFIDTGLREYTVKTTGGVETSRSESATYYALVVGDKFLIVKGGPVGSTAAEGELAPWPAELEERLFNTADMRRLRPRFYSFFVSDESFRLPGYIAIGVVLVLAFLFVRYGIPAWRHYRDPGTHPLLARIGPWGDPLGVAVDVERDFGTPRYKGSGWRIGDKYLVQSTFFTFNVLRVRDLLWAYKKVTKHSVNFIPTGKTYEAILTCYGGAATIRRKQQQVDDILAYVQQRVPWALLGYSADAATLLKKKPQEFAGAIEQRRAEWEQKTGKQ